MQTSHPFPVDDRYKSDFPDIGSCSRADFHKTRERLLSDRDFLSLLPAFGNPEELLDMINSCDNLDTFQQQVILGFLVPFVKRQSLSGVRFEMDEAIDPSKGYLFLSNHRDIIMDSTLLASELYRLFNKLAETAIGNNLMAYPWIQDLTRLCKCFTVIRDLNTPRERYEASCRLSRYIRRSITEGNEFVWLAQREGRAKDSNDRTQTGILKMLNLSGDGNIPDDIASLNLIPLSISYEFDPCDSLKARELLLLRKEGSYHKAPGEDVLSMKTGILGYKGEVFYHLGTSFHPVAESIDRSLPTNVQYRNMAESIDRAIHRNHHLFSTHYAAAAFLAEADRENLFGMGEVPACVYEGKCTDEERTRFETYMNRQLQKVNSEFSAAERHLLRIIFLAIYATPVRNRWKAEGLH